ncbi:MAG: hypothetical protein R3B40_15575 [Polyangiales bacterium]|nr:hypothetical protein [Sandaracinaceae bacterium]
MPDESRFMQRLRSSDDVFRVGHSVLVLGSTIAVSETTAAGRPARVDFRGAGALDGDDYLFVLWSDGDVRRFPLPHVGSETVLPATDMREFAFGW